MKVDNKELKNLKSGLQDKREYEGAEILGVINEAMHKFYATLQSIDKLVVYIESQHVYEEDAFLDFLQRLSIAKINPLELLLLNNKKGVLKENNFDFYSHVIGRAIDQIINESKIEDPLAKIGICRRLSKRINDELRLRADGSGAFYLSIVSYLNKTANLLEYAQTLEVPKEEAQPE
jgi:hypothetical protein